MKSSMKRRVLLPVLPAAVFLCATALLLAGAGRLGAQEVALAATPPMGWNSWNKFGCNVSES